MKFRLDTIWNGFLDLLFPPKCPFCGAVLTRPGICGACADALPWYEDGFRVIRGLYCAAPLRYEGVVRETILQFKFRGRVGVAQGLGRLLAVCAAERLSGTFDVVTYAPVSRERRRKRGYNQSQALAEAACRVWGARPEALLVKIADNPPQSGLSDAAARWKNVAGVYRPAPGSTISGRRVLLIDDVCTSGATLCECASVLRDAGAASVRALTLAAAVEKREKARSAGD